MTDTEVKAPKIEFPQTDYPIKVISDTGVGNKDKIIEIVLKHATINDERIDERQSTNGKYTTIQLHIVATDRFGNGRCVRVDAEQRERPRAVRYVGPRQMRVAVGREPVRLPHRELRRDRTGILETVAPKAHVRLLSKGDDQASGYPRRTATGVRVANGPARACAYWRQ